MSSISPVSDNLARFPFRLSFLKFRIPHGHSRKTRRFAGKPAGSEKRRVGAARAANPHYIAGTAARQTGRVLRCKGVDWTELAAGTRDAGVWRTLHQQRGGE